MRIILIFLISIALCSFRFDNQENIEIRLVLNKSHGAGFEQITIKNKKEIIFRINSDKDGLVSISRTIMKEFKDYDLYLTTIGVKGTYLTTINSKTTGAIQINLPKRYKLRSGKAICPKCNKILF